MIIRLLCWLGFHDLHYLETRAQYRDSALACARPMCSYKCVCKDDLSDGSQCGSVAKKTH